MCAGSALPAARAEGRGVDVSLGRSGSVTAFVVDEHGRQHDRGQVVERMDGPQRTSSRNLELESTLITNIQYIAFIRATRDPAAPQTGRTGLESAPVLPRRRDTFF